MATIVIPVSIVRTRPRFAVNPINNRGDCSLFVTIAAIVAIVVTASVVVAIVAIVVIVCSSAQQQS